MTNIISKNDNKILYFFINTVAKKFKEDKYYNALGLSIIITFRESKLKYYLDENPYMIYYLSSLDVISYKAKQIYLFRPLILEVIQNFIQNKNLKKIYVLNSKFSFHVSKEYCTIGLNIDKSNIYITNKQMCGIIEQIINEKNYLFWNKFNNCNDNYAKLIFW